ncbi:cytokine receptor common subunit gamma-like [Odontesthes bonariensis]|uniref:cytokine receptor common subunit gamma-like n=1 Tax=Odontesthes bonariensis TaxID=219752 RepID=UPI003F58E3E3
MMPTRLLLFVCLTGHVLAKKTPDVECLVVHLEYVSCSWKGQGTPEVNYTFSSWFSGNPVRNCTDYLSENSMNTGCNQPYTKAQRFNTFYTVLTHGNEKFEKEHDLKSRVKLNPPNNLTVQNGSDFNLWFYWNQTFQNCVESEVRYRTKSSNWETSPVFTGKQKYCINLPSSTSRYELQVRSRVSSSCGKSIFWSDWSQPVVWGSNNGTDTDQIKDSMPVWTPVLYVVGGITLILLVTMLLHNERLRIILIPVVPKPSLSSHDFEFQFSKGLKEGFKANYNERACPVREYTYVSRSESESSDSSGLSVATNQTDCSVSIAVNEPEDLSVPFTSSTASPEEKQQITV